MWNPLAHNRTDIVTARLDTPLGAGVRVLDARRRRAARRVEHDGRSVSWLAPTCRRWAGGPTGWFRPTRRPAGNRCPAYEIANEHYRLRVDPARGGGVVSLVDVGDDVELIAEGRVGNELAVYEEYSAHPTQGEGPWHLLPKGPVVCSSAVAARRCRPTAARSASGWSCAAASATLLRYTQSADAVARRRPSGLQHHDRRVHRGRLLAAAALAVPGAGRHAGQRGRRRRRRARVRVAARRRAARWTPPNTRGRWTIRPTAGSGCRRRRGSGSASAMRARCRWPRWSRRRGTTSGPRRAS